MRRRFTQRTGVEADDVVHDDGMDQESARQTARRVGLITLPIGLGLMAAPSPVARALGATGHGAALRAIGVCDLALVPGLVLSSRQSRWMVARVALNVGIAGYCLGLVKRNDAAGAKAMVAAMIIASATDVRTIAALRRATIHH